MTALADPPARRINPYTGKPYSPEAQAAYDAEMKRLDEETKAAEEASEKYLKEFEEIRKAAAAEIKKFDDAIEDWREAHPAPAGTKETQIASSYSGETALGESATITYFNRWNVPTHTVEFGADGQPTTDVTQTQQGKAWETIGPKIPPGGGVAIQYDKDFDGNEIMSRVRIFNARGRVVAIYEFNFDGVAWRGETWDDTTGKRNGGFQDDRLKPPKPTFGGPLAEPPTQRAITGVCEICRPLANEHNDIVARINQIVIEMRSLSQQHQRAYPPAQKPIRMRHAYLAAELARLMPQFEALRARVLECEKQCRAAEEKPPVAVLPDTPLLRAPEGPGEPAIAEEKGPFETTREAIPAADGDLQQVIDAAQAYLAAANCEGMECPVCDCDQAREAMQALVDMEAYLTAMEPYIRAANDLQMERLKVAVENETINADQRQRTIKAIAFQQYFHNFGSMLLDIASVGSWVKEVVTGKGMDEASPAEMLDKLNGWYEAAKDLESLVNTGAESLTGEEQTSGIADAVDLAGGVDKDLINDTTSTIADAKSIIAAAIKEGKDWRKALKDEGAAAALGQIAGRYLKAYSAARLKERQGAFDELLRDADAAAIQHANIAAELKRVQTRRFMLEDALAAVRAAKAAYTGCVWAACGPMTLTRPTIPNFVEQPPGGEPRLSWGKALPWFNEQIARTLPRMKPVTFREGDCPKEKTEEPRTATGDPSTPATALAGDAPALARPQFVRVPDVTPPASFCSAEARVAFLTDVYNPAVANALANARVASEHQAYLNDLFTKHMRANSAWWGQVRAERDAFEPFVAETAAKAEALRKMYDAIIAVPVVPCDEPPPRTATGPTTPPVEDIPVIPGTPATPTPPAAPAKPKKDDCPPKQGRNPIVVGPNSKVGTGAQLSKKLGGMALGALAGAAGLGGGGGGGSSEPQLWTCKIKDSEMTVFDDPTTGVSLAVGAKRAGGKLVIFSKVAKSPDKGTFQTAFLERPSTGETIAPSDIGPCDLWGEWKLTVSWTKSTYVDGQLVSRESGGWSEGGFFRIPGTLSKVDAPDGLWKRMGMSTATSGVRQMAAIFNVPQGSGPLTFIVHVTRPKRDPVDTTPFVLQLVEGPDGKITIAKAEDPPCPEDGPPESILDDIDGGPPVLTGGTGIASDRPVQAPASTTPPPETPPVDTPARPVGIIQMSDVIPDPRLYKDSWRRAIDSLDSLRCHGPIVWSAYRDAVLRRLEDDFDTLSRYKGEGPMDTAVDDELARMKFFLGGQLTAVRAMTTPGQPGSTPPAGQPATTTETCPDSPPESLLDDIEEVPPLLTGGTGIASDSGIGFQPTTPKPPLPTFQPADAPYTPPAGEESGTGMVVGKDQAVAPRKEDVEEADIAEQAVTGLLALPTDQRAAALVRDWRKQDDEAISRIETANACSPEERAKLLKELKWRLGLENAGAEPAIQAAVRAAMKIDGDRIRKLIELLEDDDKPCAPLPAPPPAAPPSMPTGMTTTGGEGPILPPIIPPGGTPPPMFQTTPREPIDPAVQRKADGLRDEWLHEDEAAVKELFGPGGCDPARKAAILAALRYRLNDLMRNSDPELESGMIARALEMDGDRIRKLIEEIEGLDCKAAATGDGTPPPAPLGFDPAEAGKPATPIIVPLPPLRTFDPPAPDAPQPPPERIIPAGNLDFYKDADARSRAGNESNRKALEDSRCLGPEAWNEKRQKILEGLRKQLRILRQLKPEGPNADAIGELINAASVRITGEIEDVEAMQPPPDPKACTGESESILDDIDEVFVPA